MESGEIEILSELENDMAGLFVQVVSMQLPENEQDLEDNPHGLSGSTSILRLLNTRHGVTFHNRVHEQITDVIAKMGLKTLTWI